MQQKVEDGLKALQGEQATHPQLLQQHEDDLKAREAKLADRDSALSKVVIEQAAERELLDKL